MQILNQYSEQASILTQQAEIKNEKNRGEFAPQFLEGAQLGIVDEAQKLLKDRSSIIGLRQKAAIDVHM